MALKIKWSPRAVNQLEAVCEYISRDSEFYAILFAKRINALVKRIPEFPNSGRTVPEYGREDLREKIYGNYRIIYRIKEGVIEIAGIYNSTKPLENLE